MVAALAALASIWCIEVVCCEALSSSSAAPRFAASEDRMPCRANTSIACSSAPFASRSALRIISKKESLAHAEDKRANGSAGQHRGQHWDRARHTADHTESQAPTAAHFERAHTRALRLIDRSIDRAVVIAWPRGACSDRTYLASMKCFAVIGAGHFAINSLETPCSLSAFLKTS